MITNEIYPFLQAYALIIGLVVGSFLNVVIYRIPNNKSIVKPRSKCTGCENQIAWYDNIPIISYIILLAKCRNCKAPISIRYPMVEFICGMMTLMLLNIYGPSFEFIVVVLICLFVWIVHPCNFFSNKDRELLSEKVCISARRGET